MNQLRMILFVSAVTAIASAAQGGDIDASKDGLAYAQTCCATCHGVAGEPSPLSAAPRFNDVAAQRGITAMSLQVWLQTSHPTMPNIVLTKQDTLDVVAYILSLKGRE